MSARPKADMEDPSRRLLDRGLVVASGRSERDIERFHPLIAMMLNVSCASSFSLNSSRAWL